MIYINSANTPTQIWLDKPYVGCDGQPKLGTLEVTLDGEGTYTYSASTRDLDGFSTVKITVTLPE